jgi:hypothetical protein
MVIKPLCQGLTSECCGRRAYMRVVIVMFELKVMIIETHSQGLTV